MNTQIFRNKLKIILIVNLFSAIFITAGAYAEDLDNKTAKHNFYKTDEGMLFTFMRRNYRLEGYAAATGVNIKDGDDMILAGLPYRSLYHKLQNKLLDLALAEAKMAVSQNDITEEMQKVMNSLITEAGGGFDRAILAFREKFKEYPNTADLVSLIAASINDAKEIFDISDAIGKGNTAGKPKSKELLIRMYDDEINDYKNFIKNNENALKIISELANNEFKIQETVIECQPIGGHTLCEAEKKNEDIKNFSEIMPYVIRQEGQQSTEKLLELF